MKKNLCSALNTGHEYVKMDKSQVRSLQENAYAQGLSESKITSNVRLKHMPES